MNDKPDDHVDPQTGEVMNQQFLPPLAMPSEASLAVALQRAEVDQAIMTAKAFPRKLDLAIDRMKSYATVNQEMASQCIYAVPRGGKMIRGPSIRFAELVRTSWGNCRDAARPLFIDRLERAVEVEGLFHDLETNITTVARERRPIELKRGKTTLDQDMIQLATRAGMSIARRNAILGGIPRPIWMQAYEAAEDVIKGDLKSLAERRDLATAHFFKLGVTPEKLFKALEVGGPADITLDNLVTMSGWRTALNQGDVVLEDLFPEERPAEPRKDLGQRLDALASRSMLGSERAASEPPSPAQDTSVPPVQNKEELVPEVGGVTPMAPSASAPLAAENRFYREPMPPPPPEPAGPVYAPDPQHPQQMPQEAPQRAQEPPPPPPAPKPSAKRQSKATGLARLSELAAEGDAQAVNGLDALNAWLDQLGADDQNLLTVGMMKRWQDAASK